MYLEIDTYLVIQADDKASAFTFNFIINVYTILLNSKKKILLCEYYYPTFKDEITKD